MRLSDVFKNIPLFSCLGKYEIRLLEEIAVEKSYKKNTIIINEGDTGNSLYVVLSGKAQAISADESGKEIVLNVFGKDDYFGEMSFIDGEPRCAAVRTKENSRLLIISGDKFKNILMSNPEFMFMIMKGLLQKIRTATRQIETLAFRNGYERVSRLLMGMAKPYDDKMIIDERLTQQTIADRVGISREIVNRIMKELSVGGFVTTQKGTIIIHKILPDKF